jgi:hypothetical protein
VASPSDRLAELRAALLELEACVAKYRGVRVPRRSAPEAAHANVATLGGDASAGAETTWRPRARRILPLPIRALVEWWRRSRKQAGTSGPSSS